MLRLIVLVLIFANGVYFAWTGGWLQPYGFAPAQQSEPQRLAQQIKPEAIKILTPEEYERVQAQVKADLAPKECLQAGPFDDTQVGTLRLALDEALPADAWQLNSVVEPARWIVYMGKFASAAALAKKRAELQALNLSVDTLNKPELEPGLSLGGFDTPDAANAELARLTERGVKSARVVQERAERQASVLRLPALTEALKGRLANVKPALAGKALKSCE